MPLKSLGLASDVMVLGDQSQLEEHSDRFILRSPAEPNFWFGNMVIFKATTASPEEQVRQFQADFPKARHVTLAWDIINMHPPQGFEWFSQNGFEIDQSDVLVLSSKLKATDPPEGVMIRPLQTDEDWQQATDLQGITGLAEGHAAESYLPYIRTRMETCRRLTEEGLGLWFGAFSGDDLAGDLGIYANPRTARFQAVETRKSDRRRGICAALVTAATQWALAKYPDTTPIIIAEQDGDAGRIYRRCGYALTETLISAYRGSTPKGPKQD